MKKKNQKKKEYLAVIDEIKSRKVILLSKEKQVFSEMRTLVSKIAKSHKKMAKIPKSR